MICPDCNGSGKVPANVAGQAWPCPDCDGTGEREPRPTITDDELARVITEHTRGEIRRLDFDRRAGERLLADGAITAAEFAAAFPSTNGHGPGRYDGRRVDVAGMLARPPKPTPWRVRRLVADGTARPSPPSVAPGSRGWP